MFAFRWFRVFHWGCYVYFRIVFSSNSLYILYIFGGGEGCHLRVVPLGQLLRRPSTPKPFIEPGFSIFLPWSFLCLLSGGFSLRLLCLFSNSFQFKFLYILYIFIFIYFIYFFIVLVVPYSVLTDYDRSVVLTLDDRPDPQLWGHCRSTHNSMICFFGFAVVSLWHPGDGRDVRKKPLPYNYFFTSLFYRFLCGILADNAACHREAIAVQLACGDLRCPHGSWSLCDVLQYHRPYYQLWGHCKSLIFENFLWFNDFFGHTGRKVK